MTISSSLASAAYSPNRLLDALLQRLGLRSDNALSRKLKVARRVITNIRCGRLPVGASLLLWMEEATGITIAELRRMLGDRRAKVRLCYALGRS
jgi:hypothetical protein